MTLLDPTVRLLLTQAENFARRENFADAVARARAALDAAKARGDSVGEALASQALASFESGFEAWNDAIAARRKARIESAEAAERAPLPGRAR